MTIFASLVLPDSLQRKRYHVLDQRSPNAMVKQVSVANIVPRTTVVYIQ